MSVIRTGRLGAIEALRGAAAAAVIFFHSARHIDMTFGAPDLMMLFQAGHSGVDLFFVISGFIILFVHRQDFDRPDRIWHYLGRRCSRVLPLYWVALLLTIAMVAAGGHELPDPFTATWQALLLPTSTSPLLGIAWTLQFEAIFYLVFALLLLRKSVGLLVLLGSIVFLMWIAFTGTGLSLAGVETNLCGVYGLDFGLGMVAAEVLHRAKSRDQGLLSTRSTAIGAGLLLITAMLVENAGLMENYRIAGRFAYSIPSAVLISSLTLLEQRNGMSMPRWLQTLGSASYSIYLFQFVFIGIAWQLLQAVGLTRAIPKEVIFLLLASTALIGGVAMSRFVELPLLGLIRGKGVQLSRPMKQP